VNNASPEAQLDIAQQDPGTPGLNLRGAVSPRANLLQISDSTSAVKARIDGAFDLAIAGHHEQFSANGDTAGIITAIDGATATKKFSAPFHSVPVCTVTPLADRNNLVGNDNFSGAIAACFRKAFCRTTSVRECIAAL
jgi:hypothetical protein